MPKAHLLKLLHSPLFYAGFLACAALSLYSVNGHHNGGCVIINVDMLIGLEFYRKLFVLFAALPFSSNFADEWNSKVITNCISRRNARDYAVSNVAICFLSAFAVVFAGMMIFVCAESARMPLCNERSLSPPYGELAKKVPLLAIAAVVFVYALSCAMWAVMGLAATAFFPNKSVALCAPFVLCYMLEKFTSFLPGEFQLAPLSQSWSGLGALPAFAKSVGVILAITALCAVIFTLIVKRRVENELP